MRAGSLEDVELNPEEYEKYLTLAYKEEKFAKPKNVVGLTKSLPVPEMEQLMLANINAGDSEMRDLAERRAAAARDWLVGQGGVPGDRMFVLEPKVEAEAGGKKSGQPRGIFAQVNGRLWLSKIPDIFGYLRKPCHLQTGFLLTGLKNQLELVSGKS